MRLGIESLVAKGVVNINLHAKIIQTVIRYNVHIIKIFIKKKYTVSYK